MAKKDEPQKQGRLKQFVESYKMTRESDPRIGWLLLGAFVIAAAIVWAILYAVPGGGPLDIVIAVLFGILAALFLFARRAEKAAYAQIEGRPGAGAAALGTLRRGWKVEPAVSFNKSQDIVHRVVGPPGIVLIGEGNPNRLKTLLANERRKHERVASDTEIHEVVVGEPPDGVPIPKLSRHVRKLGKSLKPADMTDVLARLKALDANRSAAPMPKGPVPTNLKGMRGNMRGR